MKPKLKPIDRQTILITGATSGIGLTTARMAAAQGANVVLVAIMEVPMEDFRRMQQAEMHPVLAAAVAVGIVLGVAGMLRQARRAGAHHR